jgi:hypothetical protein
MKETNMKLLGISDRIMKDNSDTHLMQKNIYHNKGLLKAYCA